MAGGREKPPLKGCLVFFLAVTDYKIPSQPPDLDIHPGNIWARGSIPALISAESVTSSSRVLGKRKVAVTQRSHRRGNPRDWVFFPRVTTYHGSGDDQHHAARGGSAASVVRDEAGEDPPCKKESQVSVTPPQQ